jgi:plasmid stabilization system protein ParE
LKRAVRVLRRAQIDLLEIRAYVSRDRPQAADTLVASLLEGLRSLERFSERGAVPRDARLRRAGYRCLVRGEYLIFYKSLRRQIRVYRILHGRRQYAHLL